MSIKLSKEWFESKGFIFNRKNEWWQRTWRTHVPEGEERCLEVFKEDDGKWKSIMYSSGGEIFYEQKIDIP